MNTILLLVRRSLRQHLAATVVTVLSISLASGLAMSIWTLEARSRAAFTGGGAGFDAVLGARGSQLQLVLNSVFHLETSPGNIPWSLYDQVRRDPRVELAVPYAVGDNFRGFRIVGTTEDIFSRVPGRRFSDGIPFDPGRQEAVLGSTVAAATGLNVGDIFHPSHGTVEGEGHEHKDEYTVTGILAPSNTPDDRAIWIPIEGIFRMSGHVLRGSGSMYEPDPDEDIADEHKEVSAVLLRLKDPAAGFALDQSINKDGRTATLAWPVGRVMAELFDKLGWVNRVLKLVAVLVAVVAGCAVAASLYGSLEARRREFAILRAIGASRATVFVSLVAESASVALLGSLAGYAVYLAILGITAGIVRSQTGVVIRLLEFHPSLVLVPFGMTLLGGLTGLLPAWRAYRTDVASNLGPVV